MVKTYNMRMVSFFLFFFFVPDELNNFSTHSSTSDRWVDPHSNAAAYGPTSCFLADSRWCQRRTLDIFVLFVPITDLLLLLPIQFIVHFHQAVLENNLAEITVAYESGWNKYTEKFYAKTEWPEAELIAPLVNDSSYSLCLSFFIYMGLTEIRVLFSSSPDPIFLILYRELYYRHVYSRLQPNIDDRFHSYENSCELFNYLLSACFITKKI